MHDELTIEQWGGLIEQTIEACPDCLVDQIVVLAETSSTQDAALRAFDGRHGVAAIAQRQTNGRGQRGNRWDDGDEDTLAISFAIPAAELDPVRLAACAGLAALESVRNACQANTDLLVKWPNDVIVRTNHGDRKVAGVLVELRDGAAVIGIGINTRSRAWDGLDAVSIEELDGDINRVSLACSVIEQLSRCFAADDQVIREAWQAHDAMLGTERAFIANNERIEGEVLSVDPLRSICVRTQTDERELDVRVTRNA